MTLPGSFPASDDTQTITVNLGDRSYPIHIGSGLLQQAHFYLRDAFGSPRCIIVTDSHLSSLYAQGLFTALNKAGMCQDDPLVLPAGEQAKTFSYLSFVLDHLFQRNIDRKTMLIALGGGVIGDLAGFAASVALRGIDFIQMPTTLLAQVDSSVGGKTAINSARGKNLIGSFHQPRMVLADVDTLKTLPTRELKAGYAEIVKTALLGDAAFFQWLEEKGHRMLQGKKEKQVEAVRRCCLMKADIVGKDEKEGGVRALLNLGHTFAHAFEMAANYDGSLLHGEAVSIGLVKAYQLSARLGHCSEASVKRVKAHLQTSGLPVSIEGRGWASEKLIASMYNDKKAEGGTLTFVLARAIGEAFVEKHVPADAVRAVLETEA
jgi:3-dehydroquinate synthase